MVTNLFKTKSLALLKLWGRALARLKILDHLGAAYSVLNLQDLEKSGSTEKDFPAVLREFIHNMSEYRVLAIVAQRTSGEAMLFAAVHQQIGEDKFLEKFQPVEKSTIHTLWPHNFVEINFPGLSVEEAEQKLVETLPLL